MSAGRVVLAKPGLDGHEAGILLVAHALIEAGFEVTYLGPRQEPSAIAAAALQEDADIVGLSILTGGHLLHGRRVLDAMRDIDIADVPVVMGGIIPPRAAEELRTLGVSAIFGPGTPLSDIVKQLRALADVSPTRLG